MTTTYGEQYLGKWKNAAPNGQGKLTVPNGSKYFGEQKDDIMWNITLYNKDGDIFGKWVNGKFVNIYVRLQLRLYLETFCAIQSNNYNGIDLNIVYV